MKKIENIIQAFRVLSALKVKEVVLPHLEYRELKHLVDRHFLNNISHNSQEKFEESTTVLIYGVQVKSERFPKYEKIDYITPDKFAVQLKKMTEVKIKSRPHTPRDELDD